MNTEPILIVAGEPKSIFLEIFFKTLDVKKFNSPIILICSMGRQSANIGETLKNKEYTNINILSGGIMTWQQEGLPLVTK